MAGEQSDLSHAKLLVSRALNLEHNGDYDQSLTLYEEGIKDLMKLLKDLPRASEEYKSLRKRIDSFLTRAEEVKKLAATQKIRKEFHEHINIKDNGVGFSYKTIFGKYLDESVTHVLIHDPYIRNHHQIQNLTRFVELVIRHCPNLRSMKLVTSGDCIVEKQIKQEGGLEELASYLKSAQEVQFQYEFSTTLHDRSILLNSGYVFKLGRGLDYFKSPSGKYTPGYFDLDFRPCHETTVDIFWKAPN